jgi:transposase
VPSWHRGLRFISPLGTPASGIGTHVRLMPPAYVKPYVKRQKNDATDAEVICEANRAERSAISDKRHNPEDRNCRDY